MNTTLNQLLVTPLFPCPAARWWDFGLISSINNVRVVGAFGIIGGC
jgi:hypothetical protein